MDALTNSVEHISEMTQLLIDCVVIQFSRYMHSKANFNNSYKT